MSAAHVTEGSLRAELTAARETLARVRSRRDDWAYLAGQAMNPDTREWLTAVSKSLTAALDGPSGGGGV